MAYINGNEILFSARINGVDGGETNSPLPIEIKSEAEMNALLNKTTPVGAIYRYMGATTETYTYATDYKFVHTDEAGEIGGFVKLVGLHPAPNNTVEITENGTHDVTFKDTVNVNVAGTGSGGSTFSLIGNAVGILPPISTPSTMLNLTAFAMTSTATAEITT